MFLPTKLDHFCSTFSDKFLLPFICKNVTLFERKLSVSCADSVVVIPLSSEFSVGPREFDEVATADLKNLYTEHLRLTFPPFYRRHFRLHIVAQHGSNTQLRLHYSPYSK